jgi:transposase
MKKAKEIKMPIVNPHSAGIDVGSRSHYVAVGQGAEDVKEFGVYSSDHEKLIEWLKKCRVTTIAMESTGSYWQSLFAALQRANFEVLLVNGNQTKNVRGKTDVMDCQWIQKMHTMGLLRGSFLPSDQTARIRTISRHRQSLIEESSKMMNRMGKCMRLLNLRVDVILSDIAGQSGIKIIEAVINGIRDGESLAALVSLRVKKTRTEIINALQGEWNDELLYELKDCYELFKFLEQKIKNSEQQIEILLKEFTEKSERSNPDGELSKKPATGRHRISFKLTELSYSYYGVDLFKIEGIGGNTVMSLIAEVGTGIYKFPTSKHFVSWARLAPKNKITGGKVISSRTPKGKNKFALALRNAANTIERQKKGSLVTFFKRIAYKKGRAAAITATARKLATIIWNMIVYQRPYVPVEESVYKEILRAKSINLIRSKMKSHGITMHELSITSGIS